MILLKQNEKRTNSKKIGKNVENVKCVKYWKRIAKYENKINWRRKWNKKMFLKKEFTEEK